MSADSTAVFRIGFGLVVTFSSLRFLLKGWVGSLYLEPANHLTYRWFEFVTPLPAPWMHLHLVALALLGVAISLGYRHRPATGLFLVGFTYIELIEASLYLNHYWFVTLVAVLLLLLPVQHRWSLDARSGRVDASRTVPALVVWALRSQLAAVYLFAGLAKLNPDWLIHAQPMGLWLSARTDRVGIGSMLDEPLVAYAASWLGAFFDCTIVGWLLWRRSRPFAYVALIGFHLMTGWLFRIGVFPWVMITSTLVFFDPDWPSRFFARITGTRSSTGEAPSPAPRPSVPAISRWATIALIGFMLVQVAIPLRHYARPGNVRWNEDGYYLSWRVMLTEKAGIVGYQVHDPVSGETWKADPGLVLEDWQVAHAATRPDLIQASAHLLADHYARQGAGEVEIRAEAWVSMNGRPAALLVDPTVDLVANDRGELPDGWILEP